MAKLQAASSTSIAKDVGNALGNAAKDVGNYLGAGAAGTMQNLGQAFANPLAAAVNIPTLGAVQGAANVVNSINAAKPVLNTKGIGQGQGVDTLANAVTGPAKPSAPAKTAAPASSSSSAGASGSAASPGYSATDIINYLNNYGNSLGQAAAQYTQSQYANAEQNLANQYALNTELGTNAYKGLANSTGAAGQAMAGDWNAATKADAANAAGNQSLLTNSATGLASEEGNIAKALGLGTSLGQPISNLNQVTQNAVQNLAGQAQTAEQGTNANAAAAQQLETNMGQNFNNASALANIQGNEAENTALGQMAQQATQAVTNARYQFMPSASDLGNYLMTDPLNQATEAKYGAQSDEYEAMGAKDLATAQATQAMSPQVATLLGTILGGSQTAGTAAASLTGNQSSASSAQQTAALQALQMMAALGGGSNSDLTEAQLLGQ